MTIELLVNIDIDNLDKAIVFYTAAFDLRVGRRFGDDGVELLGASSPIYLLVKPAGSKASIATTQQRDYQRHWTPVHLDFVVDDVHAAVEKTTLAGATLEGGIHLYQWAALRTWPIRSATAFVCCNSSGGAMTKSRPDDAVVGCAAIHRRTESSEVSYSWSWCAGEAMRTLLG